MVVSTLRPPCSAHRLAPEPRWATITRPPRQAPVRTCRQPPGDGAGSSARGSRTAAPPPRPGRRGSGNARASDCPSSHESWCRNTQPGAISAAHPLTARIAARLCGWCSGAKAEQAPSISAITALGRSAPGRPGRRHAPRGGRPSADLAALGHAVSIQVQQFAAARPPRSRAARASSAWVPPSAAPHPPAAMICPRSTACAARLEGGELQTAAAGVERQRERVRLTRAMSSRAPPPCPRRTRPQSACARSVCRCIACLTYARGGRRGLGTWSTTASTRWNRSRWLRTTMSNVVVVDPSSLVAIHVHGPMARLARL